MRKYYWVPFLGAMFIPQAIAQQYQDNSHNQESIQLLQQYQQKVQQQQQEYQQRKNETSQNEITLSGKKFEVENNVNAVGQALYISLNQELWDYAEKFLAQYLQFADHKPPLVLFAKGLLARKQGSLEQAELYYQELLKLDPQFLRGQLDLARILFENHKNNESTSLFEKITQLELPQNLYQTIGGYQQALSKRESWQGGLSIGYQYNQNINQSSQKEECLLSLNNQCIEKQSSPKSINAQGWHYDANIRKQTSFVANHGLAFSLNSYGQFYPHYRNYNENTVKTSLGYHFQNAKTELTIAPVFEYNVLQNHRNYHAWGGRINFSQNLSPRHHLNLQFEQKKFYYNSEQHSLENAYLSTLSGTWYYLLSPKTTLFSGLDFAYRHTVQKEKNYKMAGLRLGFNHQFDFGLNTTFLALLKHYRYEKDYGVIFKARRENLQTYLAIFKMPKWNFKGIVPSLLIKHSRNKANNDTIFSYKQSEMQVNFEWQF
ncbi:surface lipoprotein assembly modifier [Phocoenobacter atlanticus]|uniref:surface lipoprotein assembly modifier n=1 Tax=Phocoenobacter atlanticus TaxID=3416742 RepID=UPI002764E8FB|nr:surface lipoprotein assembly modifier [Pasteurella atlantica]MDP8100719.1 surface lipoprotein assembly modifier [Pasteurella atlantica]